MAVKIKIRIENQKAESRTRPWRVNEYVQVGRGKPAAIFKGQFPTKREAEAEAAKLNAPYKGRGPVSKLLLKEAKKTIREAKARLNSPTWLKTVSADTIAYNADIARRNPKELARKEYSYLKMRAGVDTSAEIKLKELTGRGPKFKGYVVARMMYDKGPRKHPFTFYPRKASGRPPYAAPTKAKAKVAA